MPVNSLSTDSRCTHIACLLFLMEDLSIGRKPVIKVACTSKPQAWGQGSRRNLDPGPIAAKSYSNKRRQDRYIDFDPRPDTSDSPSVDSESFLRDLQCLPDQTMWGTLLYFNYEDYDLEADRRAILILENQRLIVNLSVGSEMAEVI